MRPKVLQAVRYFDPRARPQGHAVQLSDGTMLPNEQRALQWILDTYQARHDPRATALADQQLAVTLLRLEAEFGPVEVLEVQPILAREGL